jgi:hypothetical protein
MLDILQQYLNECASPEDGAAIGAAQEIFDKLGLQTQDMGFEQLIILADDSDPGQTLTDMYNLTRQLQDSLLHQHGIRLSDMCPIGIQTDILNALLEIPELEDKHDVISIAKQPLNALEVLAELVEKVTHHSAETILEHLLFVSQSLIAQVASLADQDQVKEDDEAERLSRKGRIEKFTLWMDFCKQTQSEIQLLVKQGIDAGFPFAMYVSLIGRDFEAMPEADAAINLVGMAFLSEDGAGNPQALIAERLETLIADPEKLTRVSMSIREMLLRFAHYEQS